MAKLTHYKIPKENAHLDLLDNVLKRAKNQEHLITLLRELDYRFLTNKATTSLHSELKLRKNHIKYDFMARLTNTPNLTKNEVYDFTMVIGFKLLPRKGQYICVYLDNELHLVQKLEHIRPKEVNFKKVKQRYHFPKEMPHDERALWRNENNKILKNPEIKPSKFYLKWQPKIRVIEK